MVNTFSFLSNRITLTFFIISILCGLRQYLATYIRRSRRDWTSQQRLKWINSTRFFVFISIVVIIIFLWSEAIQGLALSIFAIAFSMVFSVKELCSSLNGTIIRFRGKLFEIGDRIEVGEIRGDVLETTLLTTTVEEVGRNGAKYSYTGRKITFANSLFLTHHVINESFLENYFMIHLNIPVPHAESWTRAIAILERVSVEVIKPHMILAKRRFRQLSRRKGLQLPSFQPVISTSISSNSEIILSLSLPAPINVVSDIEQEVLQRFLGEYHGYKTMIDKVVRPFAHF